MKKNDSDVIPFYRPRMIDREQFYARTEGIFNSNWFTNAGLNVLELERKIAETHSVRHCIAVCNGTVGLQLVQKGLELTGEVITTPFTFVATAHAIMWQGLTPVFADIDPNTLTISPERIKELITPKTSAILGVHVFGQLCDVDAINQIAQKHNLKIIYDAAHSFMTSYKGTSVGNFGDAEVLSFHATKIFHTFEGGAVLTNNDDLAERLRLLKNFGFRGIDTVDYLGINAKMSEISAAYGLSLLPDIPETIGRLKYIQSRYRHLLAGIKGLSFVELDDNVNGNGQYAAIFIDKDKFGISRDQLWAFLWANGIQTRRYFYPGVHMCEPYRSYMPWYRDMLPFTQKISEEILCLPCYHDLADEDIEDVSKRIYCANTSRDKIRAWYQGILKSSTQSPRMAQIIGTLSK